MKHDIFLPQDQVFWYLPKKNIKPLSESIDVDIAVVGGGMTGLSTAQAFASRGLKVALLERSFCGSGASGKSSGFITPDSELPLRLFQERYGAQEAHKLWDFILSGVDMIRNNIKDHNIECDYQEQDTLVVAETERSFTNGIKKEHKTRQEMGYSSKLYNASELDQVLVAPYQGAVRYGNTFGIHAARYCAGMRNALQGLGVQIYEETPVTDISANRIKTIAGEVTAEKIIIATDRFAESIPALKNNLYHVQTFLMISAPLADKHIKKIFPEKRCMVWDTDLIYHYYRVTGENRLLLGGARLIDTYAKRETYHNYGSAQMLKKYFNNKFPSMPISFEYMWPGLIGVSKDLFPLAGLDRDIPSLYYIAAPTGLPWAAALGLHCVQSILDNNNDLERYFSPYRSFTLGSAFNHILGKRLTFALSNFLTAGSV